MKPKLKLHIISQEKELGTPEADSVTLPTADGEITVLPEHIPLLTRLVTGELTYRNGDQSISFVISKGFADIGPNNQVIILVDTAVEAREISMDKAEAAVRAAHETMATSEDQRELLMAEASLKRALLEIKVAQKTKHTQI